MRPNSFLLLLLAAAAASALIRPAPAKGQEPEEYAVYRAALGHLYPAGMPGTVVVFGTTLQDTLSDLDIPYRRDPGFLPPALVADFQARAREGGRLDVTALRPLPVMASRDSTWRTWRAGEAWWQAFSRRHDGAADLVVLSRVGFLPDRSRALVQVIRNCLCSDSGGPLLLMTRAGGEWTVERTLRHTLF